MLRNNGGMHLETLLNRHSGPLTAGDRRIVEELMASGTGAAFLSSHDLARRTGLHPSSIVRFARKLGYGGFPDLQEALRANLQAGPTAAGEPPAPVRMRQRIGSLEGKATLARLVESEVEALLRLPDQINEDRLEQAARALIGAHRITVFGQGHGSILADFLGLRLRRSGYQAEAIAHLDWQAADRLAQLGPSDLVAAFVLRRAPAGLSGLMRHVASRGARLLLIGDLAAMGLPQGAPQSEPRPEPIVLAASRGSVGESQSVILPLTIVNALILAISRLDAGRTLTALDQREEAKSRFAG
jgi:DNA-binding MurR/RpiR family transcriptional regulator